MIRELIAAGISPTMAKIFGLAFEAACQRFEVNTPDRVAGLLGQCRVESADFTVLEENLNYRNPQRLDDLFSAVNGLDDAKALVLAGSQAIANRVYANRGGNGNEASGDGWRYRGGGINQLTLHDNYMAAGVALQRPYLSQPELVRLPVDACLVAAHHYAAGGCNAMADRRDWDAITRVTNGRAMLKAAERRGYSIAALAGLEGLA